MRRSKINPELIEASGQGKLNSIHVYFNVSYMQDLVGLKSSRILSLPLKHLPSCIVDICITNGI